jgi:hypothetical protein
MIAQGGSNQALIKPVELDDYDGQPELANEPVPASQPATWDHQAMTPAERAAELVAGAARLKQ